MRTTFAYPQHQVFLNYPFDQAAEPFSAALHFGVISAGLLPVCAFDLTAPDRPRLEILVEAITQCKYSVHDFSRYTGEGNENLARFNMPIEMGMGLFHALQTQRRDHRCAFFVTSPYLYRQFASDLAGLDPISYDCEDALLAGVYEWFRDSIRVVSIPKPTPEIIDNFEEYRRLLGGLRGSGKNGGASHHERQELMYQVCSKSGLWQWRANVLGMEAFPELPLAWKKGAAD
jgi:hypothetical protein